MQQQLNPPQRKYFTLFGAVMIYLVIGQAYCWGVISVYVSQYFNQNSHYQYSQNYYNIVFPISFASLFIGNLSGIPIKNKIGSRKCAFVGVIGLSLSLIMAGLSRSFFSFLFFYSICGGMSCGVPYVPALSIGYSYFPHIKGRISGICMMAFGFSTIFYQFIIQYTINPHNLKKQEDGLFPQEVANNLPKTLYIMAIYALTVGGAGAFLLKNKKTSILEREQLIALQEKSNTLKKIFSQPLFYMLIAMFSLSIAQGYAVLGNFKKIGSQLDDKFLNLVVGNLAAFGNGGFRLVFGVLYDFTGFQILYNVMLFFNIILALTFYYVNTNYTLFSIWVFLAAAIEGGHFSIFPAFTVENFGQKLGSQMFSYILISILFGNFSQQFMFAGLESSFGKRHILEILGMFSLLSLLILNFALPRFQKPKEEESSQQSSILFQEQKI